MSDVAMSRKLYLGDPTSSLIGYAAADMQCSKAKKAGLVEMVWTIERAREEIIKDAKMEGLRETVPDSHASLQRDGACPFGKEKRAQILCDLC